MSFFSDVFGVEYWCAQLVSFWLLYFVFFAGILTEGFMFHFPKLMTLLSVSLNAEGIGLRLRWRQTQAAVSWDLLPKTTVCLLDFFHRKACPWSSVCTQCLFFEGLTWIKLNTEPWTSNWVGWMLKQWVSFLWKHNSFHCTGSKRFLVVWTCSIQDCHCCWWQFKVRIKPSAAKDYCPQIILMFRFVHSGHQGASNLPHPGLSFPSCPVSMYTIYIW